MNNKSLDLSKVEHDLLNLLPKAGEVILKYWLKKDIYTKRKSSIDIVTAADLETDRFISGFLKSKYPQIPILSEETAPFDYSSYIDREFLWIVDPLDGTANFSRGDSNFCISIALVSYGKPIIGVIYKPVEKLLYWARESGAGSLLNGNKIEISNVTDISEAVVCTDWSHKLETHQETILFIEKIAGKVKQIKISGSAAANLALVAQGKADLYRQEFLYPWDTAAASLIIWESGGIVTNLHGGEWNPFIPGILAGNPVIHRKIMELIE